MDDLVFESANRFPVMDIDEYNGDAAKVAQLTRASWRLPLGPVDNLVASLESARGIIYRVDFGTRLIDAVSHWAPNMPPLFFVNASAPADRVRFSLSHEVGHVIMHAVPTPDMEREADVFASEFLMPADQIGPSLIGIDLARAAQLKPYWKVSMQALILRARDLGYISKNRASRLYMQMSSLGYRSVEPAPLAHEEPTLGRQIIEVHRQEHGYSVEDLVRLAGMPEREFRDHHLTDRPLLHALK
jgi:Zn-dependent peptidase ImmA (M78 family)